MEINFQTNKIIKGETKKTNKQTSRKNSSQLRLTQSIYDIIYEIGIISLKGKQQNSQR